MENAVRRLRQARELGQQELARLSGVSRQTISGIESGRTEPSTGLALALSRALRCTVEELFWLEPGGEALAVRLAGGVRSSRVALGSVDGRWVAHALAADALGTAADALLPARGSKVRPLRALEDLRENLLLVGCDPALGLLSAHLPGLIWLQTGSTCALQALARGEAHVAGAHLFDEKSGEFNLPFVRALVPGREVLVVNLARWRAGLAVARGNPRGIHGAADLGRRGLRIARREPGSGARALLDRQLALQGLRGVRGPVLRSHAEVAQAVALGAADAGVTTESAALGQGLRFLPLAQERSDLVLPLELSREPRGARLLETLVSVAFRRDLGAIAAYEARQCGEVVAQVRT